MDKTIPLLKGHLGYKPFNYPWAYNEYVRHEQMHWLPEEVPLQEDVHDWKFKLTEDEKHLLTQLFRFFTQADIDVADNYSQLLVPFFSANVEVRMMLSSFGNRENVHIDAYSKLLETVNMPEVEYKAFLEYQEMQEKHDYLSKFPLDTPENVARNLAVFAAFTEGMQIFSSFAIMMNFPRFNKMKGMGQIVTWSARDENIHANATIRLFKQWLQENPSIDQDKLFLDIRDVACKMVELEDKFIDLAFGTGEIQGLNPVEVKQYIRKITNTRLEQLGTSPVYTILGTPLPWLDELLYGVEHQNFFEGRATEYTKAAVEYDDGGY